MQSTSHNQQFWRVDGDHPESLIPGPVLGEGNSSHFREFYLQESHLVSHFGQEEGKRNPLEISPEHAVLCSLRKLHYQNLI